MSKIKIKQLEEGEVAARGFLLKLDHDDWILYPEPKLKTCCREGNLKEGIFLKGNVPVEFQGRCIHLEGRMETPELLSVARATVTSTGFSYFSLLLCGAIVLWIVYWSSKVIRGNLSKIRTPG